MQESTARHELSEHERSLIAGMDGAISRAKAQVYDLRARLDEAEQAVAKAEDIFRGALLYMASARGLGEVRVSRDGTRLEEV